MMDDKCLKDLFILKNHSWFVQTLLFYTLLSFTIDMIILDTLDKLLS